MKILHVEDIDFFTELVKRVCGARSLDVEVATTLTAAHSRLNQECFDLLLVDLNLPDSSGLNTVQELARYGIPIIVLTSDATEDFVEKAAELGVADYIAKENLAKIDLPLRLQFAVRKHRKNSMKKSSLSFEGFAAIKPYLVCATLAGIAYKTR